MGDSSDNNNSHDKKKRGRLGPHHSTSKGNDMDTFMNSMTFAAPGGTALARGGCDCDECGGSAFIPQAIIEAIRKHKRQRQEYMPMRRSQLRDLVGRHGSVSVYKLTLPYASDPLVEFGSSHRIIWIQHLPERSVLKTIGRGVVGSQDEEHGRRELDWKQGDVYLVPSNGGKAVAWLHDHLNQTEEKEEQSNNNNDSDSNSGGHVVLYICKVPQQAANRDDEKGLEVSETGSDDNSPEWHDIVRETCIDALTKDTEAYCAADARRDGTEYYKLPEAAATRLRQALSDF